MASAAADIWKLLDRASYRTGQGRLFEDWLDMAVAALLSLSDNFTRKAGAPSVSDGPFEDRYLKTIRPYSDGERGQRAVDLMAQAFSLWTAATEAEPEQDILGELFMEHVSHGHMGQYFTPMPICDMMAKMNAGDGIPDNATVLDPACGSGRMLIAMWRLQPSVIVTGVDLSHACCLMTVLNLFYRGMRGEVVEGNALSRAWYRRWVVHRPFGLVVESVPGEEQADGKRHGEVDDASVVGGPEGSGAGSAAPVPGEQPAFVWG